MLNYQSTSFHDALYIRKLLGLKPAPEFEEWLINNGIMNHNNELLPVQSQHKLLAVINK
jgi:ethanolamine ammonia-lyase large subunit